MSTSDAETTIDCFVRASAKESVYDSVETLQEYEANGKIAAVNVVAWPDKIRLSEPTADSFVTDLYEQFQWWASETGCSLGPAFSQSERTWFVGENTETVLSLPVLCLAVHVEGNLVTVAPHRTETGVYTVTDALADISTDEITRAMPLSEMGADSSEQEPKRAQAPEQRLAGSDEPMQTEQ